MENLGENDGEKETIDDHKISSDNPIQEKGSLICDVLEEQNKDDPGKHKADELAYDDQDMQNKDKLACGDPDMPQKDECACDNQAIQQKKDLVCDVQDAQDAQDTQHKTQRQKDESTYDDPEIHEDSGSVCDDPGEENVLSTSSHALVEFCNLDELSLPVKSSTRIKYTSITTSQNFIALGTNTGIVFMFSRAELRCIHTIQADKNSAEITHLAFGPHEQFLVYATSTGLVTVIEHNTGRRDKIEKLKTSALHRSCQVTCLVWNDKGNRVFVGDNSGNVSLINVSKELFKFSFETIMKLDSSIVQIDSHADQLLVSTETRCFLGDTEKQSFSHIGKKLRDSKQGACFYTGGLSEPLIYCARPGSRMWEVDASGTVLNTHQFKQMLNVPPLAVLQVEHCDDYKLSTTLPGPQSIPFKELHVISEMYLITICPQGMFLFNPSAVKPVLWTDQVKVTDTVCYSIRKNEVYILYTGNKIRKFTLIPVYKLLKNLWEGQHIIPAASVTLCFYGNLLNPDTSANKHYEDNVVLIASIREYLLQSEHAHLVEQLNQLLSKVEKNIEDVNDSLFVSKVEQDQNSQSKFNRTVSGIFVSRNRALSFERSGNFSEIDHQTLLDRIQNKPVIVTENHDKPFATSTNQKQADFDTVSQDSQKDLEENKIEGNWGLKNKAQGKIIKAQTTLVGLKNKLKGKLTRKEQVVDKVDIKDEKTNENANVNTDLTKEKIVEAQNIIDAYHQEYQSTEGTYNKQDGQPIKNNQELLVNVVSGMSVNQTSDQSTNELTVNYTVDSNSVKESFSVDTDSRTIELNGSSDSVNTSDTSASLPLRKNKSSDSMDSTKSTDQVWGKTMSQHLSVSSEHLKPDHTVIRHEPQYKKTDGPHVRRGQKKKVSVVSFDDERQSNATKKNKSKSTTSKKKTKIKSVSSTELITSPDDSDRPSKEEVTTSKGKVNTEVGENKTLTSCASLTEVGSVEENVNVGDGGRSILDQTNKDKDEKRAVLYIGGDDDIIDNHDDRINHHNNTFENNSSYQYDTEKCEEPGDIHLGLDTGIRSESTADNGQTVDTFQCKGDDRQENMVIGVTVSNEPASKQEEIINTVNPHSLIQLEAKSDLEVSIGQFNSTNIHAKSQSDMFTSSPPDGKVVVPTSESQPLITHGVEGKENTPPHKSSSTPSMTYNDVQTTQSTHSAVPFLGSPILNSSLPKLSTVKQKLSTKAKFLVQSFKDTKDKIITSRDVLQPLLDVVPSQMTVSQVTDADIPYMEGLGNSKTEKTNLIDLTDLEQATSTAIMKLPELMNNVDAKKELLVTWVNHLNTTLLQIKALLLPVEVKGSMCDVCNKVNGKQNDVIINANSCLMTNVENCGKTNNTDSILVDGSIEREIDLNEVEKTGVKLDNSQPEGKFRDSNISDCTCEEIHQNMTNVCLKSQRQNISEIVCCWDPFNMSDKLHRDVTYLCTLCFENACYGNVISCDAEPVDDDIHVFLNCHFHCLDIGSVHSYIMNECDHTKRNNLWKVMMKCLQARSLENETINSYIETKDFDSAYKEISVSEVGGNLDSLGHIYRLYNVDAEKAVDCCPPSSLRSIHPLDVVYMALDLGNPWQSVLQQFVMRVLSDTGQDLDRMTVLSDLCHDTEVYTSVLQTFLEVERPITDTTCQCGAMPRPLSHLLPWTHKSMLMDLLSLHADMAAEKRHLCFSHGFWLGYMYLLSTDSTLDRIQRAALVLQLNDSNILSSQLLGYLAVTEEEWLQVLRFKHRLISKDPAYKSSQQIKSHVSSGVSKTSQTIAMKPSVMTKTSENRLRKRGTSVESSDDDCTVFVFCDDVHNNVNSTEVSSNGDCVGADMYKNGQNIKQAVKVQEQLADVNVQGEVHMDIPNNDGWTVFCLSCREQCEPSQINMFSQTSRQYVRMHLSDTVQLQSDIYGRADSFYQNLDSFPSLSDMSSHWLEDDKFINQIGGDSCRSNQCSDWQSSPEEISWEDLAHLLVDVVGTRKAFTMLECVDVPLSALPLQFYQDCITLEVLANKNRKSHQGALEQLEQKLWQDRPSEGDVKVISVVRNHHHSNRNDSDQQIVLTQQKMCLDIQSSCIVCGLSLTNHVVKTDDSVILFPCDHGFHRTCVQSTTVCMICAEDIESDVIDDTDDVTAVFGDVIADTNEVITLSGDVIDDTDDVTAVFSDVMADINNVTDAICDVTTNPGDVAVIVDDVNADDASYTAKSPVS